jgi:hypothetical protein
MVSCFKSCVEDTKYHSKATFLPLQAQKWAKNGATVNPLTLNNLQRCHAVIPLKIKIPSKNMREKPTYATINHSAY